MSFFKKDSKKPASKAGKLEHCANPENSCGQQRQRTPPKHIPGVKIRRTESKIDLSCDLQTQTCKCCILQPEPILPHLPQKADPVLIQASSEFNVYIRRTPENIYRLIAKRQDSDEEFLNIALNHAKYVIKSDTWHEIELTQCGRKKTIVLNFKNSSKRREENFHSFFNDLLNILHNQRALARVAVFYPAGYHYAGTPTEEVIKEETLPVDLKPIIKMENGTLSPADVLNNLSKLAESLEGGDVEEAKYRAATLAQQKVKVHFEVLNPLASNFEKEFSVKVCVEDRDSSGGAITLMVRQSDTVARLKQRIERDYGFPQAIQKWIIGQRIPRDEDVLKNCGVKGPGCTLFLYLVSSRSVGLTREAFMQAQAASGDVLDDSEDDQNAYMSMDHFRRGVGAGPGSVPGGPVATQQTKPRPRPRTQQSSTGGSQRAKAPPLPSTPPPPLSTPPRPVLHLESTNRPHAIAESVQRPRQRDVEIALGQPSGASAPDIPSTETEGWICPTCTYINLPTRPGCEMCSESRPADYKVPENFRLPEEEEARLQRERQLDLQAQDAQRNQDLIQQESSRRNYQELLAANDQDFIPNNAEFDCPICFEVISPGEGVVLRECLHSFCRACLAAAVQFTDEAALQCPYQDDNYSCPGLLQQREIRALVEPVVFERFLQRGLQTAENQAVNSYHCKTRDCSGWCIYEDLVNFFDCPVCGKQNCLTCKAIHEGMNCQQYQTDLRIRAENDMAAQQTHLVLQNLLLGGEAMHCPTCHVIVQKKEGCDWVCCSICKTEICWVTKGPRWGPNGEGDISGGCRCKVNNQKCHPDCTNCH